MRTVRASTASVFPSNSSRPDRVLELAAGTKRKRRRKRDKRTMMKKKEYNSIYLVSHSLYTV